VQVRRGGRRGAMALAGAVRVQHRSDECHLCRFSWGASDDARRVATEDEVPLDPSSGEAAEKLVDLELDAPARDDLRSAFPA